MSATKILSVSAGVILTLLVLGALFIWWMWVRLDGEMVRDIAQEIVLEETGRVMRVDGDINLRKGWRPVITANDVRFEDAGWTDRNWMMTAEKVRLKVKLTSLLFGPVIVKNAEINGVEVYLNRKSDGEGNWSFNRGDKTEGARKSFPRIENFSAADVSLFYRGRTGRRDLAATFDKIESTLVDEGKMQSSANGALQGDAFEFQMVSDPWDELQTSDKLFAIDADIRIGEIAADLNGAFTAPLRFRGGDSVFTIRGDNLANLFDYTFVSLPETPPYEFEGKLSRDEESIWRYESASGTIGATDIAGDMTFQMSEGRPRLGGDLTSETLYLKDIAGLFGLDPDRFDRVSAKQTTEGEDDAEEARTPVVPETKFQLDRLRAMDADVTLRAREVRSGLDVFDALEATINLADGVLEFSPFAFWAGPGDVNLFMTLDATTDAPVADIKLKVHNLPVSRISGDGAMDDTRGPLSGNINLSAEGSSPRSMLRDADGNAILVMNGGKISHLLVELMGLDLAEMFGVALSGDEPIDVNCAIADLRAEKGVFSSNSFVFDTVDTIVVGEGEINMKSERAKIKLRPHPKDFSPLTFKTPIAIEGPLSDLEIFPDPTGAGSEGFLAKAVNAIATPVLGLLPPFDTGDGDDADCAGALTKAGYRPTQESASQPSE